MIELRYLRSGKRRVIHVVTPVAVALSASLLAGCSAGIARFDNPSFAFNDTATGSVGQTSSGGHGGSNLSDQSPAPDYSRSYTGPVTSTQGVSSSTLPDVAQAPSSSYSDRSPSYSGGTGERQVAGGGYGAPPSASYDSAARQDGQTIVVQPGDTLYGLSRRYGVPVSGLMVANGLSSSQLQTGQRLALPGGASVASARTYTPAADTAPSRYPVAPSGGSSYASPAASADAPSNWNGTYTVASGDALYGIARQHGVTASEIQRYNGITDPQRLAPGTVLKVPGRSYGSPSFAEQRPEPNRRVAALQGYSRNDASPPAATYASPATDSPAAAAAAPDYTTQTRGVRTVSISPPATQISDASVASTGKLRWPVRGRVISNFGARKDGTHNDGVNLAVPAGAEVHAAEEGVVAYAGSELRGYGNLILLRHSNGWVTAYAHNEEMKVKRGDKVARGQIIAKAGNTGDVDQPQLHFELRMGSKPVDPLPYLETL